MKIRLTEGQYDMIRLLKEGEESVENYRKKMSELNDEINGKFNIISNTSVGEILEGGEKGGVDLRVMRQNIEMIEKTLYKYRDKVNHYFNNEISDEEFDARWDDTQIKLEHMDGRLHEKIQVVKGFIDDMMPLIDSDLEDLFKDNIPINIR